MNTSAKEPEYRRIVPPFRCTSFRLLGITSKNTFFCVLCENFASLRLKKREFNRKDAKNRRGRKGQFHAVYSIAVFLVQWKNWVDNSVLPESSAHEK